MSEKQSRLPGGSCATTKGDRLFFAAMAAIVGVMAGSMLTSGNYWCGIPAAVCTTFLVIGALTGWCPSQLLRSKPRQEAPNMGSLGIPEAEGVIDLDSTRAK